MDPWEAEGLTRESEARRRGPWEEPGSEGFPLEKYRGYLRILAETRLGRRWRGRYDASDLAQEAILKAWKGRSLLAGRSEGEVAAWLRKALAHTIANAARDLKRQKRDLRRERSIDSALQRSSVLLKNWIAAEGASPSEEFFSAELMGRLADALEKLTPEQKEAVVLRYWQGRSLKETATRLRKSVGAAALLIHRGIGRLRVEFQEK